MTPTLSLYSTRHIRHLREHPDASCPVHEEVQAEEMRELAERLEDTKFWSHREPASGG